MAIKENKISTKTLKLESDAYISITSETSKYVQYYDFGLKDDSSTYHTENSLHNMRITLQPADAFKQVTVHYAVHGIPLTYMSQITCICSPKACCFFLRQ